MAFLEINGTPWDIAPGSTQDPDEQIGGSTRAQDGTLRWRVSALKRSWSITSSEYDRTDINALRADLTDPNPLNITGDWFNATCRAEVGSETPVPGDAGLFVLDFRLIEV